MKFKIEEIGLFSKKTADTLKFNDSVNIISGTSKTGKSSIGKIINYCLASSTNVIPEGVIRKNVEIYSMLVTINSHLVLIARNRFYSDEILDGNDYIYIEYMNSAISLKDISYSYFIKNDKNYMPKKDFLELEVIKYFPSFPPKTRKDGKDYVRPSIRNMTPFIFQNQNIIANESTLFFDMDRVSKQRGIIRDFELFLGLVNNDVYNKINRKNELIKLIKKIENKQEFYKEELDKEITKLKGHYRRLYSHFNVNTNIEDLTIDELKSIDKLNALKIDYNLKSKSAKKYQETSEICNKKSRIVEKLKIECSNIEEQIRNINKTSLSLVTLNNTIHVRNKCPLCDSSTDKVFEPFIKAKEKIISEQNFLNNYNQDILTNKFEARKEELESASKDLRIHLEQLYILKEDLIEVKSMEESIALQNEIKGIIKSSIQNVEKYEKLNEDVNDLEKYKKELEKIEKALVKVNLKRIIQESENKISEYATSVLEKLPFEEDDYGKANLKFTIKDISFYQQNNTDVIYMYEMGSAENYLACHLAIFLGIHKFIQRNKNSILPSLIFLDQPSQAYFPEGKDFEGDNISGDMLVVRNIYKTIIELIDEWNKNQEIKIQVIIVDHFYDKEEWFQEKLLEKKWDKNKKIGLIKNLMK